MQMKLLGIKFMHAFQALNTGMLLCGLAIFETDHFSISFEVLSVIIIVLKSLFFSYHLSGLLGTTKC